MIFGKSNIWATGNPTRAIKEFGGIIYDTSVNMLCEIIEEFYKTQLKLKNRKLNRKCTKF